MPSLHRARQSNLALVLKDCGQLEESRELLSKALTYAEKFASNRPSLHRLNPVDLAVVLRIWGS